MRRILLVTVLGATLASARALWFNGSVAVEHAGITMYRLPHYDPIPHVNVLGDPIHGCWTANASKVQQRVVWVDATQPKEQWLRCTFQQRILAQQMAGAAAVVIGQTYAYESSTDFSKDPLMEPFVIMGWGAGVSIDSTIISGETWRRLSRIVNGSSTSSWLEPPTTSLDKQTALVFWNGQLASVVIFCILFAANAATLAYVLWHRIRILRRTYTTWDLLRKDVSLYVLVLGIVSSVWKCVFTIPIGFNNLFAIVSWPTYLWITEVNVILLYDIIALFLFTWSITYMRLRDVEHHDMIADENPFKRIAKVFIVTHTVLGVATLVATTFVYGGRFAYYAVRVASIVCLCVQTIYLCYNLFIVMGLHSAKMLPMLVQPKQHNPLRYAMINIGIYCVVVVAMMVLDLITLTLSTFVYVEAIVSLAIVSNARFVIILGITALFYLQSFKRIPLPRTESTSTTMPEVETPRGTLSPRGGGGPLSPRGTIIPRSRSPTMDGTPTRSRSPTADFTPPPFIRRQSSTASHMERIATRRKNDKARLVSTGLSIMQAAMFTPPDTTDTSGGHERADSDGGSDNNDGTDNSSRCLVSSSEESVSSDDDDDYSESDEDARHNRLVMQSLAD